MPARSFAAYFLSLLALAGCGGRRAPTLGKSSSLECAPYARQVSGVQLYGDAAEWWDQAEGRYARSTRPSAGAILVFRRSDRLPFGHVSVVSRVLSRREIRVTQANWVYHRLGQDDAVMDVSEQGDWSAVRVWWPPSQALGATTYPAYGFVGPS